jgi:hypothetical protein
VWSCACFDLPRELALVTSVAEKRRLNITSLLMLPPDLDGAPGRSLIMRIGTIVARPFVEDLRQLGIAVDGPELGDG